VVALGVVDISAEYNFVPQPSHIWLFCFLAMGGASDGSSERQSILKWVT
jgi:hypothetical protein